MYSRLCLVIHHSGTGNVLIVRVHYKMYMQAVSTLTNKWKGNSVLPWPPLVKIDWYIIQNDGWMQIKWKIVWTRYLSTPPPPTQKMWISQLIHSIVQQGGICTLFLHENFFSFFVFFTCSLKKMGLKDKKFCPLAVGFYDLYFNPGKAQTLHVGPSWSLMLSYSNYPSQFRH